MRVALFYGAQDQQSEFENILTHDSIKDIVLYSELHTLIFTTSKKIYDRLFRLGFPVEVLDKPKS